MNYSIENNLARVDVLNFLKFKCTLNDSHWKSSLLIDYCRIALREEYVRTAR